MALINCPECSKQVSSTAATCPNCGAPIAQAHANTTIQKTSKRLKLQYALACTILGFGMLWWLISWGILLQEDEPPRLWLLLPLITTLTAGTWAITIKIQIWWHHE